MGELCSAPWKSHLLQLLFTGIDVKRPDGEDHVLSQKFKGGLWLRLCTGRRFLSRERRKSGGLLGRRQKMLEGHGGEQSYQ
jgi:hypothetical protein